MENFPILLIDLIAYKIPVTKNQSRSMRTYYYGFCGPFCENLEFILLVLVQCISRIPGGRLLHAENMSTLILRLISESRTKQKTKSVVEFDGGRNKLIDCRLESVSFDKTIE